MYVYTHVNTQASFMTRMASTAFSPYSYAGSINYAKQIANSQSSLMLLLHFYENCWTNTVFVCSCAPEHRQVYHTWSQH